MKQTLLLSHSKRMYWQQCHRKFYWQYVEGIKVAEPAAPLLKGIIGHKAVEAWLKGDKAQVLVDTITPVDRELGNGLKAYFEHWTKHEDLTYIGHSVPFKVFIELPDYPDVECIYVGELDAIAVDQQERPWIVERKFTKQIPSNLVSRFQLDDQVRGYTTGARVGLKLNVMGAIVDICRHTSNPVMVRDYVVVEERESEEFIGDLYEVALEILRAGARRAYPMSPHSCHVFGECPYHRLCLNPDKVHDLVGTSLYVRDKVDAHELGIFERTHGEPA